MQYHSRRLGAEYLGDGRCRFLVWAPKVQQVELEIVGDSNRRVKMQCDELGYYFAELTDAPPGTRYLYRLNDERSLPDPASRFQPEGVHGPSEVVDFTEPWSDDAWHGIPLHDYVLYELHVGTFTPEGTFDSVIPQLDHLKELGVTAIELLPVAQFPGGRNWGYDGVYPYATQNSYGGPAGLRRLVEACHARGLAVVMDVVYNHLGPEGSYLTEFGHYFTQRYRTPWGAALNFDAPHSDEVRRYFIENAVFWVRDLHMDALRLDAVHAIYDESARPFLRELAQAVHFEADRINRRVYCIAESNKNDSRHVLPAELGGFDLDGQWNDDFHHIVHAVLTGEQDGYYADFQGLPMLGKALTEGFVYTGEYSRYRGRRHGVPSHDIPSERLVVFTQNHDQTGNRLGGERTAALVSDDQVKLAAGLTILSPYIPLLFMGEEYGETAPFLYFVSHGDEALIEAVRQGRREEFASFDWQGEIPDPQSESTFRKSMLQLQLRDEPRGRAIWNWYRELLRLRREVPALTRLQRHNMLVDVDQAQRVIRMQRTNGDSRALAVFSFTHEPVAYRLPLQPGQWHKALDAAESRFAGAGSKLPETLRSEGDVSVELPPWACVLLVNQK